MRADNHEPLDQIAKFADVSGPTVSGEHGQSCVADLLGFAAIGNGEFSEKMARQNGYALNALAQSWNREGYYVQAIKKVFPKQTPGNLILELFIRCGDHAHVYGCRVIGSHTLEPLLLEDSKYLGLSTQTHIADFVQEERAVIRLLKFADFVFTGAGEAALYVTESFRINQLLRDGPTIDL